LDGILDEEVHLVETGFTLKEVEHDTDNNVSVLVDSDTWRDVERRLMTMWLGGVDSDMT